MDDKLTAAARRKAIELAGGDEKRVLVEGPGTALVTNSGTAPPAPRPRRRRRSTTKQ